MCIGINYSGQEFFRVVEKKRVQIQNLLYGLQGPEDWPGYIKSGKHVFFLWLFWVLNVLNICWKKFESQNSSLGVWVVSIGHGRCLQSVLVVQKT